MENFLVVNLGLKSIRIIIFNEQGQQIYSKSKAVYSKLNGNTVEQDADEWNRHLNDLLLTLKTQTTLAPSIAYITSTTSSSCIYGVDQNGKPTTPVMMVSDKRSHKQVAEISNSSEFKKKKGEYGYQCSTSSTIPKILWQRENNPELFNNTEKWIGAGEFINHFFTKQFFTDPLNASKSFHNGVQYDADILSSLELSADLLPKVKGLGTIFEIDRDLHSQYGISETSKYVLTTYDAICAVIGAYDGSDKTACDVSGTVTSVRILTEQTLTKKTDSVLLSQELGLENKRLIGASNNMGGGIVEWCKQAYYEEADKNVYYDMENDACNSTIGAKGMIFLPYLLGERAPFKSLNAKATFFGISRDCTRDDFTRAVLESTAFVTRDLLELSTKAGLEVDALSVSGGLARFDLVNQIKADVTNLKVKVLENFESTSVGAYILMCLSIGKYSNLKEASDTAVRVRKIIHPSMQNHQIYQAIFKTYKKLNSTFLKKAYKRHSKILRLLENHSTTTISNL